MIQRWDAWGSALSDLIESLPVAAVASNHEIEVNPNTGQAFAHFRQRFRGPGEESEAEEVETEAAENKVSSSSSPLPFSEKVLIFVQRLDLCSSHALGSLQIIERTRICLQIGWKEEIPCTNR